MLTFFLSTKRKVDRFKLRNWLRVAIADKNFADAEMQLILSYAARHGIADADFHFVISDGDNISEVSIGTPQGILEHLIELILIVFSDGNANSREWEAVKLIARRLGVADGVIDSLCVQRGLRLETSTDGELNIDSEGIQSLFSQYGNSPF